MINKLQRKTVGEMVRIGCTIVAREKIMKDRNAFTMNADAISKGAVVTFFTSLPWLEKFMIVTNPDYAKNNIRTTIFLGDIATLENLVMSTYKGGTTEALWE